MDAKGSHNALPIVLMDTGGVCRIDFLQFPMQHQRAFDAARFRKSREDIIRYGRNIHNAVKKGPEI